MKVLVVDDDRSVRESLGKVLDGAGYEVALATDGQDALERFDPREIDLLLLDIGLPVKNGWETFERMTSQNPCLPIIVITGQSDQFKMASAAGVGALMEKPLDAPLLLRTMRELLAESKEARLRQICGYDPWVRFVPASGSLLLSGQRKRGEKPFSFRRSMSGDPF